MHDEPTTYATNQHQSVDAENGVSYRSKRMSATRAQHASCHPSRTNVVLDQLPGREMLADAEVSELDVVVAGDKDVRGLDICAKFSTAGLVLAGLSIHKRTCKTSQCALSPAFPALHTYVHRTQTVASYLHAHACAYATTEQRRWRTDSFGVYLCG